MSKEKSIAEVKNGEVVNVTDSNATKLKRTRTSKKAHLNVVHLHLSNSAHTRLLVAVEKGLTTDEFIEMCLKGWALIPFEMRGNLYDEVIVDRTPPSVLKVVTRTFEF